MSCKKVFTRAFVSDACTNVFVTKNLKKHREDVLLDREKSLLPETQPYVLLEKERRKFKARIQLIEKEKEEILKLVMEKNIQITRLNDQMHRLRVNNIPDEGGPSEVPETERRKFIRKCPMTDCRGFLSSQWKCGSCDARICNKCNEEKVEDHECDPDNVKSMELLNKDTKPCPECATMIFKISGCSQMYCTECHTPWDWNSGRKVAGVIHNPHYYEFMRNGGGGLRNNADIPCGGLPNLYSLRTYLNHCPSNIQNAYYNIHNIITHIQHQELRNIVNHELDPAINRDLRVRYLLNDISDIHFKELLQQKEKHHEKMIEYQEIYQMFVTVASDIITQLHVKHQNKLYNDTAQVTTDFRESLVLLDNLINYFNENFKKIGKMFKCVYPGITKTYYLVSNIEKHTRDANFNNIHATVV
jgi:hypothetical protein